MEHNRQINAIYNQQTIRVYQAYCQRIAQEAVRLQHFGEQFSRTRMTWIKPSFLWMMYRSGWAEKKDQECILAIDLRREVFESLLRQAVLTSPDASGICGEDWRRALDASPVRVQWDPDRKPDGDPIGRAAIQMGVRGSALEEMLGGIACITDITAQVRKWNAQRKSGSLDRRQLPQERLYPVADAIVRRRLAMD